MDIQLHRCKYIFNNNVDDDDDEYKDGNEDKEDNNDAMIYIFSITFLFVTF